MGNFYTNYTLRGPRQQAVAVQLSGRSAIVTPAQNSCVVVFDEQSDDQDSAIITQLGTQLSRELRCPVLAVLNHDDAILWYQLFQQGELTDDYNSSPGYFDPSAGPTGPVGGDAIKLCAAFEAGDALAVEGVLRKSRDRQQGYRFVAALGLSAFAVGAGYRYVSGGELPNGLAEDDLIRVT
jgi:hypothetical protein